MSAVILSLISGASAAAASTSAVAGNVTTTVQETIFTTYCDEPTTFTYHNKTYTVTEPTTITITDCSCTEGSIPTTSATLSASCNVTLPSIVPTAETSAPGVSNGAAATKMGFAVGIAAAVAYLI
ncbi:hypothetical protein DASB73_041180 [Starmerella bacillaris]|uniref:Uncharacterized protein n=1 Tax=Starmerella bacillaris TaxID=1247836 RepID=A0AAV5RNQ3_STABA|nr:hypothetical protein DASB73_041180 [Starmerella bacillaris]